MGIVGDHPESGVRFVLERPLEGGPPWVYRGDVFTPNARFSLEVSVASDGGVAVAAPDALPGELAEKVRLLFRTLHRQSCDATGATRGEPPRKVVRWRGEK
jgi:hypothetical protein